MRRARRRATVAGGGSREGVSTADEQTRPALIRVGIVDDHPAIAAALAAALGDAADLRFVGSARDGAEGLALAALVDVLVCDLQLGAGMDGLRLLAAIHQSGRLPIAQPPAVIILSSFDQASLIRAAMDAGAVGFIHKSAEIHELATAIRAVAEGGTAFSADAIRRARMAPRRPSERELEVIDHVVGGATNGEVAARLGLSEKTVESHLRRLFDRYGLLSRTELAVLARDEGWSASTGGASGLR